MYRETGQVYLSPAYNNLIRLIECEKGDGKVIFIYMPEMYAKRFLVYPCIPLPLNKTITTISLLKLIIVV